MVKLTGPGLGRKASGTLAGQLTFSNWKGQQYLKKHTKPKQPRTGPQVGMRAMMRFLSQQWSGLADVDQATWIDLAHASEISPFNAYLKDNLKNWRSQLWPSKTFPAARALTTIDIEDFYVGGAIRSMWIYLQTIPNTDVWGWTIHLHTTSGSAAHWNNLIEVAERIDATVHFWYFGPVAPGTYYATARVFSRDGAAPAGYVRGPFTVTN